MANRNYFGKQICFHRVKNRVLDKIYIFGIMILFLGPYCSSHGMGCTRTELSLIRTVFCSVHAATSLFRLLRAPQLLL